MTTAVLAPPRRSSERSRVNRYPRSSARPVRTASAGRSARNVNWGPLRLAGVLIVLGLMSIVGTHAMVAAGQVNIDRMTDQTRQAESRYQQARVEYAQLASPSNIVTRAAALGLVSAEAPPIAIPVMGTPPKPASESTPVLDGWANVKPSLGTRP